MKMVEMVFPLFSFFSLFLIPLFIFLLPCFFSSFFFSSYFLLLIFILLLFFKEEEEDDLRRIYIMIWRSSCCLKRVLKNMKCNVKGYVLVREM